MQRRASGGRTYYSGGDSEVAKEAAEKKRGGKVVGMEGKGAKHRMHKKRGGGVGSDQHPFSSAKTDIEPGPQ